MNGSESTEQNFENNPNFIHFLDNGWLKKLLLLKGFFVQVLKLFEYLTSHFFNSWIMGG